MPTIKAPPSPRVSVAGVDESALVEAQKMLGTASPGDTVNEALREAARRRLAKEYIEYLQARVNDDEDPDQLRAQAWR